MDDKPRWIGDANKPTSTNLHECLIGIRGTSWPPYATSYRISKVGGILADQNGGYGSTGSEVLLTNQQENIEAESIRTEPIYSDLERVPVQKKSRYHRYRKSTGMKAVGRCKAFWLLRRYQCRLLKELWEDVEGSAMSHKGYSRIYPRRPEMRFNSRTVPMYASSTRGHFVSPTPYLTEAGRESISRKVPSEQLRNRFQAYWKKMARISWIRFYNERHAMRKLWYGTLWWAHCPDDAGFGYKPQQRAPGELQWAHPSTSRPRVGEKASFPAHLPREWHNPSRPKAGIFTVAPGGPFAPVANIGVADSNRGSRSICPMHVRTLARDVRRPSHTLAPHMYTSVGVLFKGRGVVPLFHGGGTTPIHQVNDTHLHQHFKKEYKKYIEQQVYEQQKSEWHGIE